MAGSGQLSSSVVQALLQDGKLAGFWMLDATRTEVRLQTRHARGCASVVAVFRQVEGTGAVSVTGGVTGAIAVAVGSIDTNNLRRDEHLRSAGFLDAIAHPNITYAVDGVTRRLTRTSGLRAA